MDEWIAFVAERLPELWLRLGQHLMLTGASTGTAIVLGVPLGIVAARTAWLRGPILGLVGILQTIPSLAMLTLLLALLHKIGVLPAIIALTLYALLPIVRNTITGLEGVPGEVMQAARGIGMTPLQRMWMVRLPLALPVIVAGVRTAAVIGVGIATLSAFIGAGGLGQFINRGLALADTRLIILGAAPAALLALVVDFAVGAASWALDPRRRARVRSRWMRSASVAALVLPLLLFGSGAIGYLRARPDVTIGSKGFTEQILLGQMMALLIEQETDLTVDRRFVLGGTMICHGALENGEIDVYAEYTGTALTAVLGEPPMSNPQQVLRKVSRAYRERYDAVWLEPFGFNNTYAITVRGDDATANGWRSISDLRQSAPNLTAGFPAEFSERPDGYPGFKRAYGFEFGSVVDIDAALMYDAVAAGEVDVIAAFATDGRIAAYDLRPLVDDRAFFPPYYAAPVIRGETLRRYPQLGPVLRKLGGVIDNEAMQRMNYEVDERKRSPADVAREFLRQQGLLKE